LEEKRSDKAARRVIPREVPTVDDSGLLGTERREKKKKSSREGPKILLENAGKSL